jgi:hypothetical protein
MMPTRTLARLGRITLLVVLCCLVSGCGKSKITKENFDKITNDMTLEQVEAILGRGDPQGDGSNIAAQAGVDVIGTSSGPSTVDYLWEKGNKSITVTFNKQKKVVAKRNSGL